jgi:hypothetical protein
MHDDTAEILKPRTFERGAAKAAERDAKLPGFDDPYQAAGHPENGELSRLVLVMGKDGFKPGGTAYLIMQYVHISMGRFGFLDDGQWFDFVFADVQPKLVTARGRNLVRICDYLSLRRMPWIRQADRDFWRGDGVADTEPIITRLEVTDWVRLKE